MVMTHLANVVLAGVVTALVASGCSVDGPPGPTTASHSATAGLTDATDAATANETPTGPTVNPVVAECQALTEVVSGTAAAAGGGNGLNPGELVGPTQVEALTALRDGFKAVHISSDELQELVDAVVKATQTILDAHAAGEPLRREDDERLSAAIRATGAFCVPLILPTP